MTLPVEYVVARKVLLDTLDLLQLHIPALVLVGAQAVYERTGPTGIGGVEFTTDGDFLIDADLLAATPEITKTLEDGGFTGGRNPGSWLSPSGVAIDLMVTPGQSGRTSAAARSARLPPHGNRSARPTPGLEPCLVDHSAMRIRALDPADRRDYELQVAGPAALITAKLIKIEERLAQGERRVRDKDAVDILRLLVKIETDELVAGFRLHESDPTAARISQQALAFLAQQASPGATSVLSQMIATGTRGDATALSQWDVLVGDLLAAL